MLSGSKDGKILMWNPQPAKNQLKLIDGYKMLINFLPNSLYRSRGVEMGGNNKYLFEIIILLISFYFYFKFHPFQLIMKTKKHLS